MLLLTETAAGFGLFQLKDKKLAKCTDPAEIAAAFKTPTDAAEMLAFHKFADTKAAMEEVTALNESKMGKQLKKFLKKSVVEAGLTEELAVIDKNLGIHIKEKFGVNVAFSETVRELQRALRMNMEELVTDFSRADTEQMSLSLAHSLSRFKLKFSPDKVDIMIIQAIGLLDDLDKELNNFAMRLKEWYGWHFPEMQKIVTDSLIYAKSVKLMGMRSNCKNVDFHGQLGMPEEMEEELKKSAETSYGTEITQEDLENILVLADRVSELLEYRKELSEYLKLRMAAIAPNLTHMVGELVGARLISHAGSLMNLAKHPASTVQVLGAEKALFRAMKTKTNTPKYGLVYHANLVGKTASKFKGKISRVLAAKMALSIRVDALGDDQEATVARSFRNYVEKRINACEDGDDIAASKRHLKKANNASAEEAKAAGEAEAATYNQDADATAAAEKKDKKEKKAKKRAAEEADVTEATEEGVKEKKKKRKVDDDASVVAVEVVSEKKKKKKKSDNPTPEV